MSRAIPWPAVADARKKSMKVKRSYMRPGHTPREARGSLGGQAPSWQRGNTAGQPTLWHSAQKHGKKSRDFDVWIPAPERLLALLFLTHDIQSRRL